MCWDLCRVFYLQHVVEFVWHLLWLLVDWYPLASFLNYQPRDVRHRYAITFVAPCREFPIASFLTYGLCFHPWLHTLYSACTLVDLMTIDEP